MTDLTITSLMHIKRGSKIYLDKGNTLIMADGTEYKDGYILHKETEE